jgi:methionyl-tRNA synthetase
LREVPFDADGNFSWGRFEERYTSELADAFGNLASRVLAMLDRYRGGVVPVASDATPIDLFGDEVLVRYAAAMDGLLLHRGAAAAWELVAEANAFVERQAPWALAKKGDDAALDATLAALARALLRLAVLAAPFMPASADALSAALGQGEKLPLRGAWERAQTPVLAGAQTGRIPPLFPKPERG